MVAIAKRHKSFTPKNRKKSPPLSFELFDETFHAYPDLQGAVILEFAAAMAESAEAVDEDGEAAGGGSAAGLIINFFDKALKPESLKSFKKLVHDPEKIIEADELAEIVSWLMEQYTSRNLEESSEPSSSS